MNKSTTIYEKLKRKLTPDDVTAMEKISIGNPIINYNNTVQRVPAYREFLKDTLGEIPEITSMDNFRKLPLMDKDNYIKKYPPEKLCLDGTLQGKGLIYLTSGTTQQATHWAKSSVEIKFAPLWFFREMEENYQISTLRTLIIIALPLGPWVGGGLTGQGLHGIALECDNVTLVTPGSQLEEVVEIMKRWSPCFQQTILAGYPSFTKTIVDKAVSENLPVKDYNIKLLMIGEAYSQEYRKRMMQVLGHDEIGFRSVWSFYGSCDFGLVGKETALTILAGKELHKRGLGTEVLGQREIPSICQYDNRFFYMEEVDNELIITRCQGFPVVRYRTGDRGKVYSYEAFISLLKKSGIDVEAILKENNINENTIPRFPFVILYGRMGGGVKFRGNFIRVEQVKDIMETCEELTPYFTDRFRLSVSRDENIDPVLELILEKKEGVESGFPPLDEISRIVGKELGNRDTLYSIVLSQLKEKAYPVITIEDYGFFDAMKILYV